MKIPFRVLLVLARTGAMRATSTRGLRAEDGPYSIWTLDVLVETEAISCTRGRQEKTSLRGRSRFLPKALGDDT